MSSGEEEESDGENGKEGNIAEDDLAGERSLKVVEDKIMKNECDKSKEGGSGQEVNRQESQDPSGLYKKECFNNRRQGQPLGIMRRQDKIKLPKKEKKGKEKNNLRGEGNKAQKV